MDYFPNHISTGIPEFKPDRDINEYTPFEPFKLGLVDNMLIFTPEQKSRQIRDHFRYILPHALNPPKPLDHIPWTTVSKRLSRCRSPNKKNTDVTCSFRIGNTFLTKKLFTFGLRKTGPGKCHVYQTFRDPILFYLPMNPVTNQTRYFNSNDEVYYPCYVLKPHSTYLVGENISYLILTVDTSYFAVHVMHLSEVDPTVFQSPTETPLVSAMSSPCPSQFEDSTSASPVENTRGESSGEEATANSNPEFVARIMLDQPLSSRPSLLENVNHGPVHRNVQPLEHRERQSHSHGSEENSDNSRLQTSVSENSKPPAGTSSSTGAFSRGQAFENTTSVPPMRNSSGESSEVATSDFSREAVAYIMPGQPPTSHATQMENGNHISRHRNVQPPENRKRQRDSLGNEERSNIYRSQISVSGNSTEASGRQQVERPALYMRRDSSGNFYLFLPIDMNCTEREPVPVDIRPFMKYHGGRCYTYVPRKIPRV